MRHSDIDRLIQRGLAVADRIVGPSADGEVRSSAYRAVMRCAERWEPERAGRTTFEQFVAVSVRRSMIDEARKQNRWRSRTAPLEALDRSKAWDPAPLFELDEDRAADLLARWQRVAPNVQFYVRLDVRPGEELARIERLLETDEAERLERALEKLPKRKPRR